MRRAQIIGVASGLGAPDTRCAAGPRELLDGGLVERLRARGVDASWRVLLHPRHHRGGTRYRAIADLCRRTAREVGAVLDEREFVVVLGGDHTCAIGTWSGAAQRLARHRALGLVWIDAHMDSHTPATSYSGMPHGMPLAALLGCGGSRRLAAQVASILTEGQISPAHTALVGIRSFQPEEAQLLTRLGVKCFGMEDIHARGVDAILNEAVTLARQASAGYGLSIDLDAIDPRDAPGVGTPEPDGIASRDLANALARCMGDPHLIGLEIVEYNPFRDVEQRTVAVIEDLLAAVLGARASENRIRTVEWGM
ncbi:MAG TPA: arginase [Burkholderiales bacterium]|nr:arginase [Burkholderiales bacterium]